MYKINDAISGAFLSFLAFRPLSWHVTSPLVNGKNRCGQEKPSSNKSKKNWHQRLTEHCPKILANSFCTLSLAYINFLTEENGRSTRINRSRCRQVETCSGSGNRNDDRHVLTVDVRLPQKVCATQIPRGYNFWH